MKHGPSWAGAQISIFFAEFGLWVELRGMLKSWYRISTYARESKEKSRLRMTRRDTYENHFFGSYPQYSAAVPVFAARWFHAVGERCFGIVRLPKHLCIVTGSFLRALPNQLH